MSSAPASAYPPDDHILRDLRLWIERSDQGACAGLEVVPELLGATGALRAGILGILIDTAGGDMAVRTALPGWVATSDLVYHVLAPVRSGTLEARPSLLRRTRTTLVIEVDVGSGGTPVVLATMTFALLEAKSEVQRMGAGQATARTEFHLEHSRMREPFAEAIGARVVDARAGAVELTMSPYVGNSLGALQGGVAAALLDLSAESAAGAALGRPCASVDLAVNYLSLGKVGPIRSRARLLKQDADRALVRVELHDAGADDRLLTVATITAAAVD